MNVQTMNGPQGVSLAIAAQAYARVAQVREFQNGATGHGQTNPGQINLVNVINAIRNGPVERRIKGYVALSEFMRAPDQMRRRFRAQLRELTTAGDMPTNATIQAYIDKFLIVAGETDLGYEAVFQTHDVSTAEAQLLRGEFKMLSVKSGITFEKRLPGEPVKMRGVSGEEVSVRYDMFGSGISIDRVYWDDQDYLMISDILTMFREAYYFERAKSAYGLITAVGAGQNYNTGADLIAKLNGAAADILRKVQGKGYMATPQTEFVVMFAPEKWGEVDGALRTQTDVAMQTAAGKQRVKFRFRPLATVHVPTAGAASGVYVILPKGKLRFGYRMDLTLFGRFDPTQYADDIAGFGRYAGIVGDVEQIRRIP